MAQKIIILRIWSLRRNSPNRGMTTPKKNWMYLLTSQRITTVCCSSCFLLMLFTKFATLTWVSNPKLSRCHYPLPSFSWPPKTYGEPDDLMPYLTARDDVFCALPRRIWIPMTCRRLGFGAEGDMRMVVRFKDCIFTPKPWGNDPIWRAYFFWRWVGSTTNYRDVFCWLLKWLKATNNGIGKEVQQRRFVNDVSCVDSKFQDTKDMYDDIPYIG